MLQPRNITKVLSQLLSSTPEITDSKPLSASLLSISLCQPIISCTSNNLTSNAHSHSPSASPSAITTNTTSSSSVSSNSNPTMTNGLSNRTMSSLGYYGTTTNDEQLEQTILSGATSTNTIPNNNYIPHHESIEDIQKQITNLQQPEFAASFVKLNLNPVDNLKIISVMLVKKWKETQRNKPYSIIRFGEYYLFLYQVNQDYLLLLSCDLTYPKALAIKRMEYIVQFLAAKL